MDSDRLKAYTLRLGIGLSAALSITSMVHPFLTHVAANRCPVNTGCDLNSEGLYQGICAPTAGGGCGCYDGSVFLGTYNCNNN